MKKRVITICGELGAGKSTTTGLLVEKLRYKHIYTGGILRKHAEELGLSLHEYHKQAEKDPQYDKYIDDTLKEFLSKGDEIICDSYLAAWFAPHAFKVFLDVDPEVAAERMFNDSHDSRTSENYDSVEEQLEKNKARRASNIKRFREYNGIENFLDKDHYDLIVDTTSPTPEQVVEEIINKYEQWLKS